jgi:hypothetical protein
MLRFPRLAKVASFSIQHPVRTSDGGCENTHFVGIFTRRIDFPIAQTQIHPQSLFRLRKVDHHLGSIRIAHGDGMHRPQRIEMNAAQIRAREHQVLEMN